MKILLNSTKTMDTGTASRLKTTTPQFGETARQLMAALKPLDRHRLLAEFDLTENTLPAARTHIARWGEPGNPQIPALMAFTGLVYKYIQAPTWTAAQRKRAQQNLRILSGLYGMLQPLDAIETYRLEMGVRWSPPGAKNLVAFWKPRLTAALNNELKKGEPMLNLASQEYMKALDLKALHGPVISPVFQETRPDGSLKTATVYAKMARGAMVRYLITTGARKPADLLGFGDMGWEASCEPPESGKWLFTRPAQG